MIQYIKQDHLLEYLHQRVQMSRRSRASSYLTKPIRLIDRDAAFKQSKGNIKIKRDNVKRSLYWADPIHSLLHWDT